MNGAVHVPAEWDDSTDNQNGPRRCANTVNPGASPTSKESTVPDPTAAHPLRVRDVLSGPMSRVDGCACGNSEPPRAAIPLNAGWRCSYLCSDCGRAWCTDYTDPLANEIKEA